MGLHPGPPDGVPGADDVSCTAGQPKRLLRQPHAARQPTGAASDAVACSGPPAGLLHHSDRGSQYASRAFRAALAAHKMVASMSRRGDVYDNAVMESCFGTLKKELVHGARYATRAAARQAIFEYIEVFYNRQRRHSTLDYRSPVEYEETVAGVP